MIVLSLSIQKFILDGERILINDEILPIKETTIVVIHCKSFMNGTLFL